MGELLPVVNPHQIGVASSMTCTILCGGGVISMD
jgi:hypothetical protein